ncbi:ErpL protein (plasmid) [Borreliella japonica]|uniref:ErpL protein n=1 Tax=Borreliella japonica TaxID=34095 RepID=UPI003AB9072B
MNKKMFIICAVFALIISCKNDVNGKALETSEQSLEISKQIEQEIKKEFNGLLNVLETKDLSTLDTSEIEKTIKDLKDKVDKSDAKKTSLTTYSEYEEKVKEIREKLKDKLKDKGELENKLKELEESLKKKKDERKKALEEAKKKFEGYKGQVDSATGETYGAQVGNQRGGGQQAWKEAKDLGLNVSYSNDADTSDMSSGIIDGALKQIEEELKNIGEEAKATEKKK